MTEMSDPAANIKPTKEANDGEVQEGSVQGRDRSEDRARPHESSVGPVDPRRDPGVPLSEVQGLAPDVEASQTSGGVAEDLCPWSELPRHMCAHCNPEPRPHVPATEEGLLDELRSLVMAEILRKHIRVVHPVAFQEPVTVAKARHVEDQPHELVDYVTALCDSTIHREPFNELLRNDDGTSTWITLRHTTTSPPLLEQLWATVEASGSAEGGQRVFASKPSARIDSIDAANDVEREAFKWLTKLGERPDVMGDTIAAVRRLGALAVSQDKDTHKLIESDVRSWYVRARVLTGWDSPAWKPNNTCPLCGVKGGLRVRLEHQSGTCVECRQTWDPSTIGLLADHIRVENHEDESNADGIMEA